MNGKPIVALCGHQGAGKSTVAKYIEQHWGFRRLSFARPLKDMLVTMGLEIEDVDGERKTTPHPLLGGKTPRFAMQTLGTEWGRNMIDPGIWLNIMLDRAEKACAEPDVHGVVIDDLRFLTEGECLELVGARMGRVLRDTALEGQLTYHQSEQEYKLLKTEFVIRNTGNFMVDTAPQIHEVMNRVMKGI